MYGYFVVVLYCQLAVGEKALPHMWCSLLYRGEDGVVNAGMDRVEGGVGRAVGNHVEWSAVGRQCVNLLHLLFCYNQFMYVAVADLVVQHEQIYP